MNEEPHGLCHISEVLDWILSQSEKKDENKNF